MVGRDCIGSFARKWAMGRIIVHNRNSLNCLLTQVRVQAVADRVGLRLRLTQEGQPVGEVVRGFDRLDGVML
jgi:hypothetical protein